MSDPSNYGIMQYFQGPEGKNPDGTSKQSGILWIYMNNGGKGMADRLATALQNSQDRWSDQPYVNAMIIAHVGREGLLSGVTFNQIDNNDHTLHLVDFVQQKVLLLPNYNGGLELPKAKMAFPIESYISKYKKA